MNDKNATKQVNPIAFTRAIEGRCIRIISYNGRDVRVDEVSNYRICFAQSGKKQGKKVDDSDGFLIVEKENHATGEFSDSIKILRGEADFEFSDLACDICGHVLDDDDEIVYADKFQTIASHKQCERHAIEFIAMRLIGGKRKKFK